MYRMSTNFTPKWIDHHNKIKKKKREKEKAMEVSLFLDLVDWFNVVLFSIELAGQ